MADYFPIAALLVVAALFSGLSFFASRMLGPRRPTTAKSAPYECGIVPEHEPPQRFPVRFYLVAMIFIIFDIEIIFIYPWAVVYRRLGGFGLLEMILFAVAVFVAFVYLISHGALDWGPVSARRPVGASPWVRTTETTIRRVGRGGEHGGEDAAA